LLIRSNPPFLLFLLQFQLLFFCIWSRFEIAYPDAHPVKAVEILMCAKVLWFKKDVNSALQHFRRAFKLLEITHGPTHTLTKECIMKEREASAEFAEIKRQKQNSYSVDCDERE